MVLIGPWEIALILIVVLIIFGPKKLPQLARAVGDAIRQYRAASEPSEEQPKRREEEESKSQELLIETAKKLGIETKGKTSDQIQEEILRAAKETKRRSHSSGKSPSGKNALYA